MYASKLIFALAASSVVSAGLLAERMPLGAISERSGMNGWSLQSSTAPAGLTSCGKGSYCPSTLKCNAAGNAEVAACCESGDCRGDVQGAPKCADPSWSLYKGYNGNGFCCAAGQVGIYDYRTGVAGSCVASAASDATTAELASTGSGSAPTQAPAAPSTTVAVAPTVTPVAAAVPVVSTSVPATSTAAASGSTATAKTSGTSVSVSESSTWSSTTLTTSTAPSATSTSTWTNATESTIAIVVPTSTAKTSSAIATSTTSANGTTSATTTPKVSTGGASGLQAGLMGIFGAALFALTL